MRPEGRLILQTVRAHDQFNTTIYSLNDRYRGIRKGRDVIFVNPDDIAELGLTDGQRVDIFSEWKDEPTGCCATIGWCRIRRRRDAPPRTTRRPTC